MKHTILLLTSLLAGPVIVLGAKPYDVLTGQSNMQGHAAVRTLDHLGMDPKTAPLLKAIRNPDGTAKVHDRFSS